jgi:outer membrane lipoprotein-sorting protein
MKKLLLLFTCFFALLTSNAQDNRIAEKILDKVSVFLSNPEGVRIDFTGSENGYLIMKGEKFYLNTQSIQSWYDGKTQWSYLTDNEEVNISSPTKEEIQAISPYHLLKRYKSDYTYIYIGQSKRKGKLVHEINLTSKSDIINDIKLIISDDNKPVAILFYRNNKLMSEVNITSLQTDSKIDDKQFRFDKTKYPQVEIIDLR